MVFLTITSAVVAAERLNATSQRQLASVKDSVPLYSGLKRQTTVTTVKTDVDPCSKDCAG